MGNGMGRVSPGVSVGHVIGHYDRDFSVELSGPLGVKPNWIILDPILIQVGPISLNQFLLGHPNYKLGCQNDFKF